MELSGYNIRVYGLLINKREEVLLSKENRFNRKFTKFPGGGHELGEGLIDGLKREFKEELGINIEVTEHFYTTDYFEVSAFDESEQLISIYYKVTSNETENIQDGMQAIDMEDNLEHSFIWKKVAELEETHLTYPIDKLVAGMLKEGK